MKLSIWGNDQIVCGVYSFLHSSETFYFVYLFFNLSWNVQYFTRLRKHTLLLYLFAATDTLKL